jgi:predicted membrane-bound spermidine synthase
MELKVISKDSISAGKLDYAGLFFVSAATLVFEVLLTRIFSVTMGYHYAFMAISIAMFGMTVGAIIVFLMPAYFTAVKAKRHFALSSLVFSFSIIFSFLTHLLVPFFPDNSTARLLSIVVTYVVISVPFVFSGICICLALTKIPRQVGNLYAADLAGAGVGCILFYFFMECFDGPTAVFVIAALAVIGSVFFSYSGGFRNLFHAGALSLLILGSFITVNSYLANNQRPLLRLRWIKSGYQTNLIYEKWNSFSRLAVYGNPFHLFRARGWGMSDLMPSEYLVRWMGLNIDAAAATWMMHYENKPDELKYLHYDIVNLAHFVRRNADVFIVGAGGGRDVLSALSFNQKSILAVEINKDIIKIVNSVFGDFTGHLDQNPKVRFVNDEARSFISRQKSQFDIIQISLIDTWAATAAGAYVLTENSLYTVEGWTTFLEKLNERGILTVSRWYFFDLPGSMYRVTSLAAASLKNIGITDPRKHVIIVRTPQKSEVSGQPDGVGTILVSRDPFSPEDIALLHYASERLGFQVVLSPTVSLDPNFVLLTEGADDSVFKNFPMDVSPPTDDKPFFFNMLRLRDIFSAKIPEMGAINFNLKAVQILGILLATVILLTFLFIFLPLNFAKKRVRLKNHFRLGIFFASIGFGFMLIEISQLQRLIIFLGHPTYALTVVLFSLLLSSSLGSMLTNRVNFHDLGYIGFKCLISILLIVALIGLFTPAASKYFVASSTPVRIAVAISLLVPIGFVMGTAFPLGMKLASRNASALTPWFWGINGATSVIASVLALIVALASGITSAYWLGWAFYLIACLSFGAESFRLKLLFRQADDARGGSSG